MKKVKLADAKARLNTSPTIPGQVERSLAGFMFRKPGHRRRGATFL